MGKKKEKKDSVEFRYYSIPADSPVLALVGEEWIQCYGKGIDYLHFHNYLEIGYCYYGEGVLVLDEEECLFHENMCSVIPKNYPHTTNSRPGTVSRWEFLFIDVEKTVHDIFPDNKLMVDEIIRLIYKKPLIRSLAEHEELVTLVHGIIQEMTQKQDYYLEKVHGYTRSLLLTVARINQDEIRLAGVKEWNLAQISSALTFVSCHYQEEIRIKTLADTCFISESHFRKVFGECMNMSPAEYINLIRISIACDFMNKTEDSIMDISQKVGFGSQSAFNRNFKHLMGASPSQWRSAKDNYERKILNWESLP